MSESKVEVPKPLDDGEVAKLKSLIEGAKSKKKKLLDRKGGMSAKKIEELEKLTRGRDLSNKGIDFSGVDLSDVDFSDSNLSGISFKGCTTNIGTSFEHAIMKKVDLQGITIDFFSPFTAATTLAGANLAGASISNVKWGADNKRKEGLNLEGACFDGAVLEDCDFSGNTQMENTSWVGATLERVNFSRANISNATFSIPGTGGGKTSLEGCTFVETIISGTRFKGTKRDIDFHEDDTPTTFRRNIVWQGDGAIPQEYDPQKFLEALSANGIELDFTDPTRVSRAHDLTAQLERGSVPASIERKGEGSIIETKAAEPPKGIDSSSSISINPESKGDKPKAPEISTVREEKGDESEAEKLEAAEAEPSKGIEPSSLIFIDQESADVETKAIDPSSSILIGRERKGVKPDAEKLEAAEPSKVNWGKRAGLIFLGVLGLALLIGGGLATFGALPLVAIPLVFAVAACAGGGVGSVLALVGLGKGWDIDQGKSSKPGPGRSPSSTDSPEPSLLTIEASHSSSSLANPALPLSPSNHQFEPPPAIPPAGKSDDITVRKDEDEDEDEHEDAAPRRD